MIQKSVILIIAFASIAYAEENSTEAKCNCAVFKMPTEDETTEKPLIMKNPTFPINCNTDGKENCAKMCVALAEAAKDKAPKVLCEVLDTTTESFSPMVFSKACGEETWKNTGLASKLKVCCGNKAPIPCPDLDPTEDQ